MDVSSLRGGHHGSASWACFLVSLPAAGMDVQVHSHRWGRGVQDQSTPSLLRRRIDTHYIQVNETSSVQLHSRLSPLSSRTSLGKSLCEPTRRPFPAFPPSRFRIQHLTHNQTKKPNQSLTQSKLYQINHKFFVSQSPRISPILEPTMNTAKALFLRALRLPKAAASGQQTRHFTVSPPSLRAANHRRRAYTPPSSFPPEPLPAWFSKPPKLPHGVETWEIVLVLGLPVVIIGWLQYTQRVLGWEDPEKRVSSSPGPQSSSPDFSRAPTVSQQGGSSAAGGEASVGLGEEVRRWAVALRPRGSGWKKWRRGGMGVYEGGKVSRSRDERAGHYRTIDNDEQQNDLVSTPAIGHAVDDHGAQKTQQRHGNGEDIFIPGAPGAKSSIPSRRVQSRAAGAIPSWPEIQQQVIPTTPGDEYQSSRDQRRSTTYSAASPSPASSNHAEKRRQNSTMYRPRRLTVPQKSEDPERPGSTPEPRGVPTHKHGARCGKRKPVLRAGQDGILILFRVYGSFEVRRWRECSTYQPPCPICREPRSPWF
ncbi:hypothetical protein KC318_g63 [Hortaea werneckii]|nr:hypothetical protein KC334_g60 [Hortaea werneckii]KAI7676795.1 hypothetical protein KC318_g63 [Hortaea werneckii]